MHRIVTILSAITFSLSISAVGLNYQFGGGYLSVTPEPAQTGVQYAPTFHYYVNDYQGNVRFVVDGNGTIEQRNDYYAYGGPWGDNAINQGFQPFKYNGKELDRMHGLDWYDYGARMYDPAMGLFTQIDPLAEQYPHLNPYQYCAGNPVKYVDPDGKKPKPYEAALMAAHVYGGKKADIVQNDLIASGWRLSDKHVSIKMTLKNGLQSALYEKTNEQGIKEYAYVFAGSNSLKDWEENVAQVGGLSRQYEDAIKNARILVNELENSELTFIGHSLGGGEAAASSMATGKTAMTFNPAAVSLPTIIFQKLGGSNNIENYISSGLKIPLVNISIGGDPLNLFLTKIGMRIPGKKIYIPIGVELPLKSHDILEIVKRLPHE